MSNREKVLTVLSLGAGVQSSTMALMAANGDLPKPDYAIFADTGYESKSCYEYLNYLSTILPYPIIKVAKGNIKNDMIDSINNGSRCSTAPYFTQEVITGKKGMLRRQCTTDYKIQPIRKKIRELCNIEYKQHFPKDKYVEQWIGISKDEIQRMKPSNDKYIINKHPLIELNMSRQDCINYLNKKKIPLPEKSACIMCPYHDDKYWHFIKTKKPDEFKDVVEFDKNIRNGSKNIKNKLYLHRSCQPLDEINFNPNENQLNMFNDECEGMCGV